MDDDGNAMTPAGVTGTTSTGFESTLKRVDGDLCRVS
jgi:hypothetical protein